MRSIDWTRTPLGPLEGWPQSLRTTVSICLSSPLPTLVWWGAELVMLYNDACRPILGAARHPRAMGRGGREVWPEVWPIIGPMLEGVLTRGEAASSGDQLLPLDRHGYLEEGYFTFSCSPIRDESGRVGGGFCIINETTGGVLGERRLHLALSGARAGAWEWDLRTQRVIWSSELYELLKLPRGEADPSFDAFLELIPSADRERVLADFGVAAARGGPFNLEFCVIRGDGTEMWLSSVGRVDHDAEGVPILATGINQDITARRLAEEQREEALRTMQQALEIAQAGAWEWDVAVDRVKGDENLARIFGLSAAEVAAGTLSAREFFQSIHPEDRPRLDRRLQEIFATGGEYEMDYRLAPADGPTRWLISRGRIAPGPNGRVERVAGLVFDITTQKQVELDAAFLTDLGERIRLSEDADELLWTVAQRVGRHLGASRCFFAEVDETADCWTVHQDFAASSEPPSMVGTHALSMFPAVIAAAGRAGRVLTVSDTAQDPLTAAFHASADQPLGIGAFVAIPFLRDGHWVAAFAAITEAPRAWLPREVTLLETVAERVWLAVEKLRLDAEVREGEERFRLLADHAPAMIWVTEPDSTCSYLSKGWYEFTGQTPETGLGFGWLDATHPDDRDRAEKVFITSAQRGEAFQLDYRLRRHDGSYRWAIDSGRPRFGPGGDFQGYIGSVIDITERKEMEEALKEADRRKDEFLAMLAHELRNPLAPIRNAAQVLKLVGPADANQQWAREVIERQTQHLMRLVDDLLDVSRITQGKVALVREPLDLATILQRAVETSRPLIEARHHQLNLLMPREPLRLEGDLTRLVQVIGNLLNNAAKFTEEGGRIELEATREGEEAVVRVRDTGVGVPADLLPHVFDLFTQADRSLDRSQGGLGIGLTLVRRLVELHGGQVEARSEGPGRGSEFIVRLPALPPLPAAGEDNAAGERAGRPAASGLRILVVEDNVDSAEILSFLLQLDGHEVRAAHDGAEALKVAHAFAPQVVLCDIGLPGMNGYEVAARLRELPAFQRTPIIALTGYGQEEALRRSREAGFDHHLVKPVEPDRLDALLKSLQSDGAAR